MRSATVESKKTVKSTTHEMIRRDRILQNATKCSRSIDVQRRELNGKLELSFISYIEPAAIDPIVTESR